jgi:hypothetical protein
MYSPLNLHLGTKRGSVISPLRLRCFSSMYLICTVRMLGIVFADYLKAVFLKLGSANGCQGFQETKMCSGGTVSLAVLNLYVRLTIRVTTFDTDHSVADSTQIMKR